MSADMKLSHAFRRSRAQMHERPEPRVDALCLVAYRIGNGPWRSVDAVPATAEVLARYDRPTWSTQTAARSIPASLARAHGLPVEVPCG